MTTAMDPPPQRNPISSATESSEDKTSTEPSPSSSASTSPSTSTSTSEYKVSPMGPTLPKHSTVESEEKPSAEHSASPSTSENKMSPMGPPPPKHSNLSEPDPEANSGASSDLESDRSQTEPPEGGASETDSGSSTESPSITNEIEDSAQRKKEHRPDNISVPYTIPPWSAPPCHQYYLEILKDGRIIDQFDV